MPKNLKLSIKNEQIAKGVKLGKIKSKLAQKKSTEEATADAEKSPQKVSQAKKPATRKSTVAPKKDAAKKPAAKKAAPKAKASTTQEKSAVSTKAEVKAKPKAEVKAEPKPKAEVKAKPKAEVKAEPKPKAEAKPKASAPEKAKEAVAPKTKKPASERKVELLPSLKRESSGGFSKPRIRSAPSRTTNSSSLGMKDKGPAVQKLQVQSLAVSPKKKRVLKPKAKPLDEAIKAEKIVKKPAPAAPVNPQKAKDLKTVIISTKVQDEANSNKKTRVKEFRDFKPRGRDGRQGDSGRWNKRRGSHKPMATQQEIKIVRPDTLSIRLPISIKDLASAMKLKAAQLISTLFMQGVVVTLNDVLEDETMVELLGHEFECAITIDTTEEERLRITDQTVAEEINSFDEKTLKIRPAIITFMGHVDHGKTSLIDYIRKSQRASSEAGSITQHIGAFSVNTAVGPLTILDTPGHEAFSAMRARGANVTDIAVLVISGDEGIKAQTVEAIQHAKAAGVTIVVAANKCDKPGYDIEKIYRQLADNELLPEEWGGTTITMKCSALTGEGVDQLLEMLAIQAEMLELNAIPDHRARGTVLESEMHKGLGSVATVLVQNGTLKKGDAIVFDQLWGRVKTMHNESGKEVKTAPPSTPVEITGLSGLPEAGHEFIVVGSEKEAREIAGARMEEYRSKKVHQKARMSMENLLQDAADIQVKVLNVLLRADTQGSLEALKTSLEKIRSDKVKLNIIFYGIGEIAESDVELAAASKALIVGFHTQVESHAESLIKQASVQISLSDVIYHAVDAVKEHMESILDKLAEEHNRGEAEVKATFKASHLGLIAGCLVTSGQIHRNHKARILRAGEVIWKGSLSSLKREKEDVREIKSGLECGILLRDYNDVEAGDIIETYEVVYIDQKL